MATLTSLQLDCPAETLKSHYGAKTFKSWNTELKTEFKIAIKPFTNSFKTELKFEVEWQCYDYAGYYSPGFSGSRRFPDYEGAWNFIEENFFGGSYSLMLENVL